METPIAIDGRRLARPKKTRSRAQVLAPAAGIVIAHLLPLTLFYTGTRWQDWAVFVGMYVPMVFSVGAVLHRYFSHRAFKTSRAFQFMLGILTCCFFGDPIGFTGKHRIHHRYSDTRNDVHSPRQGFWYCWFGSLFDDGLTDDQVLHAASDLTKYPELMWLHRYFYVPALILMAVIFAIGGYTMLITGYVLSWVVITLHGPCTVNYFCHRGKSRRYATPDDSSNRLWVSIYLLGEGWHNNHHYYPGSARAGFFKGEIDGLYSILKFLARVGLIRDLRVPPQSVIEAGRKGEQTCA
ncbi:MAG: acyl-CoA desaturase [Acidobacteria bacterium]|nr:acyl-CoA desaturase [Acidobacteriota bacterium]